ncbi:cuticle protein 16.5-like [Anopheles stephensi]|uniref:cuticle protein 16.5-like n=1 Tax=Anopheles stephensi TaxID=30069 RepID=UPI0016589FC4|nr:cuticle protein 16.5-like [Anopheles stephensi]
MKCIAAVVMVALAVVAEAGIAPVSVVYSAPETTVVQQNVAPKYVTAYAAPVTTYASHASVAPVAAYAAPVATYAAPVATYASPISYAAQRTVVQAASVAYAAPTAYAYDNGNYVQAVPTVYAQVQKEARYVAANRGAIHEAPLAGHAVNQKSLNIEPAPGTL